MINNILQVRKIEEGRPRSAPQRVLLAKAVGAVVDELGPALSRRGVAIDIEIPAELAIRADPEAVHTVLRNLLDNAGKAVANVEERQIGVEAALEGGVACVRVRDTGVGFSRDTSHLLFEKFYRLGDELRRTSQGSGLGLYLVRRLAELDGGEVSAHSDGPGTGAEFRVSWPAAGEEEE